MTWRRLRPALQLLGALLALAILAHTVRDAVRELRAAPIPFDPLRALVATGLLVATFMGAIRLWCALLRAFGARVAYPDAVQLWSFSNLGRYLPGKVWQVIGVMAVARDVGVAPAVAASVAFVSIGFQVTTGALVALPVVPFLPSEWSGASWVIGLLAVGTLFPLVFPGVIPALLRRLPRSLGLSEVRRPSRLAVLAWLLAFVGIWAAQGVSFATLVSAFGAAPDASVLDAIGTWALAYVTGLVAFFAPGGIGVREGMLAPLLTVTGTAEGSAHVLAVASRLWSIAAEVVVLGLAIAIRARGRGA